MAAKRRRALTGIEAGVILGVVALVVLCCVGVSALSLLKPDPGTAPYVPLPVASATP